MTLIWQWHLIYSRLNQLGIEPLGSDNITQPNSVHPLVEKIRKAAEQIRQEWHAEHEF